MTHDRKRAKCEPQEIIDRFRSRAFGLRRQVKQAHADIRRTLERVAPAHVDIEANYKDPTYDGWLAEAEMLERDADAIEVLQEQLDQIRAWALDRLEQTKCWSESPQRGSVEHDARKVLSILDGEPQPISLGRTP